MSTAQRQYIVCCFARPPTSALHTADRPVIALEAVRGRLPSAASPVSNMQLQSALQHAAHTADAVQPVPLDRWDANWLLLETGSRWAVFHPSELASFQLRVVESRWGAHAAAERAILTLSNLTRFAFTLPQGSQPRRTLWGVCGGLGGL